MKKQWIEKFNRILSIITDTDPIDLIAGGAPDDEYDFLALEVFVFVKTRKTDVETLSREIVRIMVRSFGGEQDIHQEKIREIAETILKKPL